MKKITIIAICTIAAIIISCKNQSSEDKIKVAFKEYVKTDFGDPANFLEITNILVVDTFSTANIKKLLKAQKAAKEYYSSLKDSIDNLLRFKENYNELVAIARAHRSAIAPLHQKYINKLDDYINNHPEIDIFSEYEELINSPDTTTYIYDLKCRVIQNGEKIIKNYSAQVSPDFSIIKIKEGELLTTDMADPDILDKADIISKAYGRLIELEKDIFIAEKDLLDAFIEYGYKPKQ